MKLINLSIILFGALVIGSPVYAEEAIENPWPWDIPSLRYQYEEEVKALAAEGDRMELEGASDEDIAMALHAKRRALGVKYKGMTPEFLRKDIFARNEKKYGDPYGPTIDYLRGQGKSWSEIRESASRPGGGDLWFNRASSYVGSWQDWLKKALGYGNDGDAKDDI